jgi:hypothetical protein
MKYSIIPSAALFTAFFSLASTSARSEMDLSIQLTPSCLKCLSDCINENSRNTPDGILACAKSTCSNGQCPQNVEIKINN